MSKLKRVYGCNWSNGLTIFTEGKCEKELCGVSSRAICNRAYWLVPCGSAIVYHVDEKNLTSVKFDRNARSGMAIWIPAKKEKGK